MAIQLGVETVSDAWIEEQHRLLACSKSKRGLRGVHSSSLCLLTYGMVHLTFGRLSKFMICQPTPFKTFIRPDNANERSLVFK